VTTVEQAAAYRERILAAVPAGLKFDPLMTLYLTDTLKPEEIDKAADSGFGRRQALPGRRHDQLGRGCHRHRHRRRPRTDGRKGHCPGGTWRGDSC
jgi:hypothetical protein